MKRQGSPRRTATPQSRGRLRHRSSRHDHDGASSRSLTDPEATQRIAGTRTEHRGEFRSGVGEESTDGRRVAHREEDPIDCSVSEFELETSDKRLAITWTGLGFDSISPVRPSDQGVPRTLVTGNGERNLEVPPETRMHVRAQVGQDGDLRPVTNRGATRVQLRDEVEAHHAGESRECDERNHRRQAPFDSAYLGIRDSQRRGHRIDAQPATSPRLAQVGADASERSSPEAQSPICGPLARGHGYGTSSRSTSTGADVTSASWGPALRSGLSSLMNR